MPRNAGGDVCGSNGGGHHHKSTQLALSHGVECFSIDAGEKEQAPPGGDDAEWWNEVEVAINAYSIEDGYFAHAPTVVDLIDLSVPAPRLRIRSKRPASSYPQGAPPVKIRRPG